MDSWFSLGSKPDNVQLTGTEPRPTEDTVKFPSRSSLWYSSPHDVVLAQMRGLPTPANSTDAKTESPLADHRPQTTESVDAPSPSSVSYSTANNPAGPREVLHDPFDGSPVGLLVSQGQQQQQQHGDVSGNARAPEGEHKEEELWLHLSRVLDLQNQVAKMHLEMESVGPNDGKNRTMGRGRARRKGKWEGGSGDHPDNVAEGIMVDNGPEGDEEGVEVAGDEEGESKKAREAEFAGLADQFEGRNESINAIMERLDLLSKALTEFHALRAPTVEFPRSSKQTTTSTSGTTPSTIYSTPSPNISPSPPNAGTISVPYLTSPLPTMPTSGGSLSATPFSSDSVIPMSLSRTDPRSYRTVSPLIINTVEPASQAYVMDSPATMVD